MGDGVSNRFAPLSLRGEDGGPSAETVSVVDTLVNDATRALFEAYGVHLDPDQSPVATTLASVELVSVIGFSSKAFSGSLLLATLNRVVEHTLPAPDASLADWSGELSNQLLGRIKNQLLEYQVPINVSLPVVIAGGQFALPARTRALTRYFPFISQWGALFVRFEGELALGVELMRQAEAEPSVGEGELLIF
jgi:CheY-specific phosphatase CheX